MTFRALSVRMVAVNIAACLKNKTGKIAFTISIMFYTLTIFLDSLLITQKLPSKITLADKPLKKPIKRTTALNASFHASVLRASCDPLVTLVEDVLVTATAILKDIHIVIAAYPTHIGDKAQCLDHRRVPFSHGNLIWAGCLVATPASRRW